MLNQDKEKEAIIYKRWGWKEVALQEYWGHTNAWTCPKCGALCRHEEVEKHDDWHEDIVMAYGRAE